MKKNLVRLDINSIKDPNVVKKLSYPSLALLCHDIRKEILEETSVYGGHLSPNLGTVELTVALYRVFNFPKDKLIFDVGHQSYTNKILSGRSLAHLNDKDAISGFQDPSESVYDCYSAGHSSTSLSAAEGFAIARDLKCDKYDVVAVIGDASIVNGLSFEALNNIGSRQNKVIIILNDNEMSISSPVGAVGHFFRKISTNHLYNSIKRSYRQSLVYRSGIGKRLYSFTSYLKVHIKAALVPTTMFDNMGFTYIGPVDGHNIKAMERAFNAAKTTTKSAVVHVRTIKGKGYPLAEKDKLGYWHSVTPFDLSTGRPLSMHEGFNSWSHVYGDLTHLEMQKHPDIELVVPAMIRGSGLEACFDDFPSRCLDVGIAEEHAITLSGALSLNGLHPVLSIYSTFLQRGYDELLHDCARLKVNMTLLIDRAGLVGKNGATHQGIFDEAFLKTIPGLSLAMPSRPEEALPLYELAFSDRCGLYGIRYPHELVETPDINKETISLKWGSWLLRRPIIKNERAIVAVGPLGDELFKLTEKEKTPFYAALFLNPLDEEAINNLQATSEIDIYDAYGTTHGFAETLLANLALKGYKGKIRCFVVPTAFIEHCSLNEQLGEFSLLPEQVYAALYPSRK
jgi:1-deoxy-D-xylulose-5-phosphate synthase